MKRSQDGVLGTRPFSQNSWKLLDRLINQLHVTHPLLAERPEVKNVTVVVFSSDRGLCGSFNVNVLKEALQTARVIKSGFPDTTIEWMTMGRKGRESLRKTAHAIVADFPKPDRAVVLSDVQPLRSVLLERFLTGQTDRVVLVYTDFISGLVQKPRVHQLLPFPQLHATESLAQQSGMGKASEKDNENVEDVDDYLFEPSPEHIADILLPSMIETMLYQALLETTASEHAARRLAMKNATDAAADIIEDLELTYNQTRQAKITQEIAEIATAAAVMN